MHIYVYIKKHAVDRRTRTDETAVVPTRIAKICGDCHFPRVQALGDRIFRETCVPRNARVCGSRAATTAKGTAKQQPAC